MKKIVILLAVAIILFIIPFLIGGKALRLSDRILHDIESRQLELVEHTFNLESELKKNHIKVLEAIIIGKVDGVLAIHKSFKSLKQKVGDLENFSLKCIQQKTETTTKGSKASNINGTIKGFNMKASFGSGKVKKRPLLAFLKDENTIPNGIYPLIIFEPSLNEFIICKGISFDNKPNLKWIINTRDDIKFKNTKYKDGLRTNSYFRNSYSTNDMTDSTIQDIQDDLESIMNDYPN